MGIFSCTSAGQPYFYFCLYNLISVTCSADLLYTSGNSHYLEQYLHDWPWKSLCDLEQPLKIILGHRSRYHMKDLGLCSVLRPHQHSIGYMGDGFYRSKDPTNSIKVLKENLQGKKNQDQQENFIHAHICACYTMLCFRDTADFGGAKIQEFQNDLRNQICVSLPPDSEDPQG